MTVVDIKSGPDPTVCMAISLLRRADLAIESPAGGFFVLRERRRAGASQPSDGAVFATLSRSPTAAHHRSSLGALASSFFPSGVCLQ